MIRFIILLCICAFVKTNPSEGAKKIVEECKKKDTDEGRRCYYDCVYTKAGTITKDGQYNGPKNEPIYNEARKCFEEFKHLESCERAKMYHTCIGNVMIQEKCAKDLGYTPNNLKNMKFNMCYVKCKWTFLQILDKNGELKASAKLSPTDKEDITKCYRQNIKKHPCQRAHDTNMCMVEISHISQCVKEYNIDLKDHNHKDINCLSLCMLKKIGIYNDKNETMLSKVLPADRKYVQKCNSPKIQDACKRASLFRMCFMFDKNIFNLNIKQCVDETKISWPTEENTQLDVLLHDESKACLLRCILKKLHVLNEENLFDAKYVDIYTMREKAEQHPEIETFVKECNEKAVHKDACVDTMVVAKCLYEKIHKLQNKHK